MNLPNFQPNQVKFDPTLTPINQSFNKVSMCQKPSSYNLQGTPGCAGQPNRPLLRTNFRLLIGGGAGQPVYFDVKRFKNSIFVVDFKMALSLTISWISSQVQGVRYGWNKF